MDNHELYHYGIPGMKWGVRKAKKDSSNISKSKNTDVDSNESNESKKKGLSNKQKTVLKIGAAAVGTALAAYGTYKLSKMAKEKAYKINLARGEAAVRRYTKDNHYKTISPLLDKGTDHKTIQNAIDRVDRENRVLMKDAESYAKRHSATTLKAIKSLMGKNRGEFTKAEMLNMGLGVLIPDIIDIN